eukprot:GFUD01030447.1.p1 GENE.GFUD01030447.1~~GFUD01030447.1.p1  ORF type:complete len:595 (+),score=131.32 GFUD01030447.1:237-1787(+)
MAPTVPKPFGYFKSKSEVRTPNPLRSLKPRTAAQQRIFNNWQLNKEGTDKKATRPSIAFSQSENPNLESRKFGVGKKSDVNLNVTRSVFKTDISNFYSNSTRKVPLAAQHGQNSIPLAKKRKNSVDFWNVDLYEDGTEDLFIEKPKRYRGRRRIGALKVPSPTSDQSEPFKNIRLSSHLFSSRAHDVKNKNSVNVKIVKPKKSKQEKKSMKVDSSPKISPEVHPCARCVDVSQQMKINRQQSLSAAEDVKISMEDGSGMSSLCEECGADFDQVIEEVVHQYELGGSQISKQALPKAKDNLTASNQVDNLTASNQVDQVNKDVYAIEDDQHDKPNHDSFPVFQQFDEDFEVHSLVIDGDKSIEIECKKSDLESSMGSSIDSPEVSPNNQNMMCWSCKSEDSLGSWHAHRWQHEKFLCSSCFNFYKDKNAERARKEQEVMNMIMKGQDPLEVKNFPNYSTKGLEVTTEDNTSSFSLQNLPVGTHNFYFPPLDEVDPIVLPIIVDPIVQALREMGEGTL